jgi:MoaA/NifB/PqqE/SkfB family radical SAM enzyme
LANIIVAQESLGGIEQIYDACTVGQALSRRGHNVTYVVHETALLQSLLDEAPSAEILQAPGTLSFHDAGRDGPEFKSHIDLIMAADFGEPRALRSNLEYWLSVLRELQPSVVLGFSAPTAWLASASRYPSLVLGAGADLPAIDGPSLAELPWSKSAQGRVGLLMRNVAAAVEGLDIPPLGYPSELLERCSIVRYGLNALDPYLHFRRGVSIGVLPATARQRSETKPRKVVVFPDARCPEIERLILSLGQVGNVELEIFAGGLSRSMRSYLAAFAHVKLHVAFSDALDAMSDAAAIVHHGSSYIATAVLRLGLPQLVLPWTGKQLALVEGLKLLGVTWFKDPRSPIEELAGTIAGVTEDAELASRARQQAENAAAVADAVPELAKQVEAAAAGAKPERKLQSSVYCKLPFEHACICTEGTARICCVAQDVIRKDGMPMSLYTNTVEEIWNSDHMKEIRRAMASGERLDACMVCYANERATGRSYRTTVGIDPLDSGPSASDFVGALERDGYHVSSRPSYVKLELGNLCNLKCRMCYGGNSSEIERDPVHSRWNGGDEPLHAIWEGAVAEIGPAMRIGISSSGILPRSGAEGFYWTDGNAEFDVPIGGHSLLDHLVVKFEPELATGRSYSIEVNGGAVASGVVESGAPPISIPLSAVKVGKSLHIRIAGGNGGQDLHRGLPLASVQLTRHTPGGQPAAAAIEVVNRKLPKPGLWYEDDALVFKDLLGDVSGLRRLFVTGGEPLLERRFSQMVDYLVDSRAAGNILLEIVTNATRVDSALFQKMSRFKRLEISLSLDATGAVFDYMRYPGRWSTVERNVRLMRQLVPDAVIIAVPVIQIYNVLDLADICRFCVDVGIELNANFIQTPQRLTTEILPRPVLQRAAEKLHAYAANECPENLREHVVSIAQYLAEQPGGGDAALLREFMLFTNDLDVTRQQSLGESLPELQNLLRDCGYPWLDQVLHAAVFPQRRPAKDRVHAWI